MAKGRAQAFLDATVVRRSVVQIEAETPIPEERIVAIVQHAILHAPSPFHVQSCRAIVLFNDEHRKMWDIAKETVLTTMPAPVFASLEPKLKEYRRGYGTVSRLAFDVPIVVFTLFPPLALLSTLLLICVGAGRV